MLGLAGGPVGRPVRLPQVVSLVMAGRIPGALVPEPPAHLVPEPVPRMLPVLVPLAVLDSQGLAVGPLAVLDSQVLAVGPLAAIPATPVAVEQEELVFRGLGM